MPYNLAPDRKLLGELSGATYYGSCSRPMSPELARLSGCSRHDLGGDGGKIRQLGYARRAPVGVRRLHARVRRQMTSLAGVSNIRCAKNALFGGAEKLVAFCWMPNQIHALLPTPEPNLASGMQHWLSGCASRCSADGWKRAVVGVHGSDLQRICLHEAVGERSRGRRWMGATLTQLGPTSGRRLAL